MATARWSAWWGHQVSARAVWCARLQRLRVGEMWKCSTPFVSRTSGPVPCRRAVTSAATGVEGLGAQAARDRLRDRVSDADPEDLLLLDDLLGIGDPDAVLSRIDPDARRRRLTALVNAASLARKTPAVYVVEDAHWIDEVSESMLAKFLTVIPQTSSLAIDFPWLARSPRYQPRCIPTRLVCLPTGRALRDKDLPASFIEASCDDER